MSSSTPLCLPENFLAKNTPLRLSPRSTGHSARDRKEVCGDFTPAARL